MISRVEKIRLGVFIVVASTVLIATLVVMAGLNLTRATEEYKVYFNESVSGLEIGAQVKYNGVRVGQVSEIKIASKNVNKVLVTLELEPGVPVKKDTKAVLTGMGITGLKFVELTGGTDATEPVPPGGTVRAGKSFMGIIGGKAEDITVKTELALNKINALMSDNNLSNVEDILTNVKNITSNVDKLVAESDDRVDKIMRDLEKASTNIGEASEKAKRGISELNRLVQTSSPSIEEIIQNVNTATAGFRRTAHDLSKINDIFAKLSATIQEFQNKLAAIDVAGISSGLKKSVDEAHATLNSIRRVVDTSRENIFHSAKSLKRTLRNLEDFSAEIRDQPSLLLSNKKQKDRASPED